MKLFLMFFCLLITNCAIAQTNMLLVDAKATAETKALANNLRQLAKQHTLFGHQHATEYGHGWEGDDDRSDVKSVTGTHPAVIGVDLRGFTNCPPAEQDAVKQKLLKNIAATYNRGGVVTVAWHFANPASGGGFYWVDSVSKPAVGLIIPGGAYHQQYKQILKSVAGLIKDARGKNGEQIPLIFRPYHEQDGNWFWWGKAHCTAAQFKSLWQFTVSFLRDSMQVHNLLYAFSPDCTFTNEAAFTERYPGNDWVDMVGFDDYADFGRDGHYNLAAGLQKLKIVHAFALQNNKLAAFTETGLESVADNNWWTQSLLATMLKEKLQICYVLVWRNDRNSPTHYYAPFPGHPSVPDFLKFYQHNYTLFQNDLKNIYQ
ncbi:MAG: hypothetical protein RL172_354 [Bacteroidota bacterium]